MTLDAAYLRVARGREHLTILKALCDDVCDDYADRLGEIYPRTLPDIRELEALFDSPHPVEQVPPRVAILVGETVYNFRAALDYLVCALSKADTPSWVGKRRNQFPIERTPEGFSSRRETFLAGLTDAHVGAIERCQPFSGCQWTERLARLSNLDKHNDLIVVAQGVAIEMNESAGAGPHQVVITPHLTLGFEDGPVLQVVEDLAEEVTKVLDCFRYGGGIEAFDGHV